MSKKDKIETKMLSMNPSEAKRFSCILKSVVTDAALEACHDRNIKDPEKWLEEHLDKTLASEIAENTVGRIMALIHAMDQFSERCGDDNEKEEHGPSMCMKDNEDEEYIPNTDKKKGMKADVMFG